jgi:hypothetical protein
MEHMHPSYAHIVLRISLRHRFNLNPKFYAQSLHYLGQSQQMGIGRFILFFPLGCVGGGGGGWGRANGTSCSRQKGFPKPVVSDRLWSSCRRRRLRFRPCLLLGTSLTSCITDEVLLLASAFSREFFVSSQSSNHPYADVKKVTLILRNVLPNLAICKIKFKYLIILLYFFGYTLKTKYRNPTKLWRIRAIWSKKNLSSPFQNLPYLDHRF